jgi:hypothetical protein
MLLQQCDMLHDILQTKQGVMVERPRKKRKSARINLFGQQLTDEQAADLYKELVLKLRTEAGVNHNQKLMDELLMSMSPEALADVESRANMGGSGIGGSINVGGMPAMSIRGGGGLPGAFWSSRPEAPQYDCIPPPPCL